MTIQTLRVEEVYHDLFTSEQGLFRKEAERRLREYGLNEVEEIVKRSLWQSFFSQFTHLLALLLWLAAALCFISNAFKAHEGMFHLGLVIVAVIVINALFTFFQEYRAEKMIQALKALLPDVARVMREGKEVEVPFNQIVPGDLLLLKEGDLVPADARLVAVNRMMVNNAVLTGESDFKERASAPAEGRMFQSPNLVFAGSLVVSGSGSAVVFATGLATELGKIAHLTGKVVEIATPLQREIVRLTKVISFIALVTGVIFFTLGFVIGRGFWANLLFAIGIIIANVPEGLLPTVSLALAMGAQRMAKKNALIKTLSSVETLGSVTVICSDKTGTLTQNAMEVKEIQTYSQEWLNTIGMLCNNVKNGKGDPTEAAIVRALNQEVKGERLDEIPFDTMRKRMSTLHAIEGIRYTLSKGAIETLLPLCTHILLGEGNRPLDEALRESVRKQCEEMTQKGLRVLAFAFKEGETLSEEGLTFVGLMGMEDPPRPEVPAAIEKCLSAGIKIIMITGDAPNTAVAIAKQVGLINGEALVMQGEELDRLSDREILEKIDSSHVVLARMTPGHKMRVVTLLEESGERVAVTGDGVNDAPALKQAHIGIAMGKTGTDVARAAADIILLDDNFASIVSAIEEGRAIFQNIRKFISYIFASNIPELIPYLGFILFQIPLPLTILQILAVDLGTDLFPALALGAERPSPGIMKEKPRDPKEKLLTWGLLVRSYLFLGPIEAVAGLFGFFYVLNLGGWHYSDILMFNDPLYLRATTACLAGIIVSQIFNLFACRTFKESVFSLKPFFNKMLAFGLLFELLLAALFIYTPIGHAIFGTNDLPLKVVVLFIPFGVGLLLVEEIRKWIVRKYAT